MKKRSLIISTILLIGFILVSCAQPTNGNTSGQDGNNFTAGWWKYTTSANNVSSSTLILYENDKTVLRAGSITQEYSTAYLDTIKSTLAFDTLADAVGNYTTFEKIGNSDLPTWCTIPVFNSVDEIGDYLVSLGALYTSNEDYGLNFYSYNLILGIQIIHSWIHAYDSSGNPLRSTSPNYYKIEINNNKFYLKKGNDLYEFEIIDNSTIKILDGSIFSTTNDVFPNNSVFSK